MNREEFPGPPYKRGRFEGEEHQTRRMTMNPDKVEFELGRVDDSVPANKILCVHILNAVYPINCEVIHRVFSKFGTIARIIIFNKLTTNSMVEFEDVESASEAKENLHGRSLYTGCCTLKIQYGKKERLEVPHNTPNSWDYTLQPDQGNFNRDDSEEKAIFRVPAQGRANPERMIPPGKVEMELGLKFQHPPNKILMISFLNAIYPVNAKLVLSICKKFGSVSKIIVFERLTFQAMVEFVEQEDSVKAEQELHGRNIYPNCNTMKVEFARKDKIEVQRNSEMTWCATAVDSGDKLEGEDWSPEGREVLIPELPLKQVIQERYMSPQAVEAEFGLWVRQYNSPSKIVLISVLNAIYPITCEVLHKICSPTAKIVRIVIFERLSVQAMIELETEEDGERLMSKLHGASIYPNCCSIKAELCKKEKLLVKRNDDATWDFTDGEQFPISSSNSGRRKVLLNNPPLDQVNYDMRVPETQVHRELNRPEKSTEPNKVLLVSVLNGIYPMDCEVAYRAFSQFGSLVRVAIFNRVTVQLMVEFANMEEAKTAKEEINGSDLYPNCCTLKAEFSTKDSVDVKHNNADTRWDFVKEPYLEGGMRGHPANPLIGGGSYPVSQRMGLLAMNQGPGPGMNQMMMQQQQMQMQYQAMMANNTDTFRGRSPYDGNMGRDEYRGNMGRDECRGNMGRDDYRGNMGRDNYRGNQYENMGRDQFGHFQGYGNDLSGGGGGGGGGTPCLMVYKMDPKIFNCDKLFNLLCLYGNIERIMFFKNLENAMVQFDDPRCVNLVKENLQNVQLFRREVHFEQSKKMYIEPVRNPIILDDGSKGYKDFSENKNNRFTRLNTKPPPIYPLSSTLYFHNTPKMTNEKLLEIFRSQDAPVPRKIKWFESRGDGVGKGIMEFNCDEDAAEAVVLVNHTTLEGQRRDINMMLTFTKNRAESEFDE